MLDGRDLFDDRPDRRRRCEIRGARSPRSPATPSDSLVTTTRPSASASPSTPIASRPSWISNGTASRESSNVAQPSTVPGLETGPAKHERPVVGVLERVLGVDPTGDADVGRLAALRELDRLGDRDGRRRGEQSPDPVARPERAQRHGCRAEGDAVPRPRGGGESPADHTGVPTSPPSRTAHAAPAARAGKAPHGGPRRAPRPGPARDRRVAGDRPWITGAPHLELVDNTR